MGKAKTTLEKRLLELLERLERPGFLFMEEGQRKRLLLTVQSILERLEALGSTSLLMGILGGTGVGKSSLMNALAGSKIAHTSHRRPDTDAVLIYRHASSPAHTPASPLLRFKEITHEADTVREIILCDLPDFDSLIKEHRDQVVSFIGDLDMAIWVVSPEKYADARFYDLLKGTAKSKDNFLFVLNKTDLLFEAVSMREGEQRLHSLLDVFRTHLASAGVEAPSIFSVSARIAQFQDAPWNGLNALKDAVFKRRDEKQILAIKAANLEAELEAVVAIIAEKTKSLSRVLEAVDSLKKELLKAGNLWTEAGAALIENWIDNHLAQRMLKAVSMDLPLVGWPGRLFAHLGAGRPQDVPDKGTGMGALPSEIPAHISKRIRDHTRFLENIITNSLKVLPGLPEGLEQMLRGTLDPAGIGSELEARMKQAATNRLIGRRTSGRILFRSFQKGAYILVLVIFLASLASNGPWEGFLDKPDLGGFLLAIFLSLRNIFSGPGLAALLSYILVNLFLGLRFYLRARRFADAEASRALGHLKKELSGIWSEALGELEGRMEKISGRIDEERKSAERIAYGG